MKKTAIFMSLALLSVPYSAVLAHSAKAEVSPQNQSEVPGESDQFIYNWTRRSLKGRWKKKYRKVARAIIEEGRRYNFDPVFLVAVIQNESNFVPTARGQIGEIGLMQILPDTGKWLAKRAHVKWKGQKTLIDPVSNVKIGAAYLHLLRDQFDAETKLYVTAYNMGSNKLHRSIEKQILPKEYHRKVMSRYFKLYEKMAEAARLAEADRLAVEDLLAKADREISSIDY